MDQFGLVPKMVFLIIQMEYLKISDNLLKISKQDEIHNLDEKSIKHYFANDINIFTNVFFFATEY